MCHMLPTSIILAKRAFYLHVHVPPALVLKPWHVHLGGSTFCWINVGTCIPEQVMGSLLPNFELAVEIELAELSCTFMGFWLSFAYILRIHGNFFKEECQVNSSHSLPSPPLYQPTHVQYTYMSFLFLVNFGYKFWLCCNLFSRKRTKIWSFK